LKVLEKPKNGYTAMMMMSSNHGLSQIKVQLVDPHQITLWGIKQLLSSDKRFNICAVASNTSEALKLAHSSNPDVIILDPDLHQEDGIAIIPALISKTNAKVIIYTGNHSSEIHDKAVVNGARGVINKSESTDTLLKAIEKIHGGELWLNRNATSRILLQIALANSPKELTSEQKKLKTLTSKEEKVTRAIQLHSEKTLRDIADTLHISEHTLRNHLASIYDKLNVRNRLELYVFCGKFQKTDNPDFHPQRRSSDK
jgi:DNA-binding NarL/FixJ family response regulator